MSTSAETGQPVLDWFKWIIVVGLVAAGIFGNWYYQHEPLIYRILALIAIAGISALVAAQTVRGRSLVSLMKEARVEMRRVVWPTRQETTQTTFIVVMLVLLFAFILWLLDTILGWVVSAVIG
jgi:preprotein translocase subunit SecE